VGVVTVGGTFHFEGEILANGVDISGTAVTGRGAGSGGGINISVNTLSGSMGLLQARGGHNQPDNIPISTGGSGGGGRIALTYVTNDYVGPLGSTSGLNISVAPGDSRVERVGEPGTIVISP
jgi:hypothetical protein